MIHLPRFFRYFVSLEALAVKFNNFSLLCPKKATILKMDRFERIFSCDQDLERQILAIRNEVSVMETEALDNYLIRRLEKENMDLEEEIEKYKVELTRLERLNGRPQIIACALPNLAARVAEPPREALQNEVQNPPQPEVPQNQPSAAKKLKKESSKNEKADNKKQGGGGDDLPVDVGRLDLRVGKICEISKHPDADSLYVEKVDIGKPEPITVVSGLVKHIAADELNNSLVIILCNLKPAKMRGITSEGMVMCASTEGKVEVLRPPFDSLPGESVTCPGYNSNPDAVMNPKKKIFETVAPDLKTDSECIATYKGARWSVGNKGFVKAQTLSGVNIK